MNHTNTSSLITSTITDIQSKELNDTINNNNINSNNNYNNNNNNNNNNNDDETDQIIIHANNDIEKEDQQLQNQPIKTRKNRQSTKPLYVNTKEKINGSRRSMTLSTTPRLWSPFRRSSSVSLRSPNGRTDLLPNQLDDHDHTFECSDTISKKSSKKVRRRKHYADTDDEEDHIIIGTKVAEGHRNYQLMYDMLTGIRIAVGRVSAKMRRDPTKEDFTAAHKLVFDITGNELTPGVKYDFKFKDYAPWVFRNLREIFHIDAADYLMSLTHKYILSELGSPGKSGSFFYFSRDYRFIIKTIHRSEHAFMRKILNQYYEHCKQNPNTLLCRIYGLHRIKLPRGKKIHFVVMGNVFPPNKNVHETYDLKGSTFGRITSDEEIERNSHSVMKDLNWMNNGKKLELGPLKKNMLLTQLEKDVKLLIQLNIMDYSLLVGIHELDKGNDECYYEHRLQLVESHGLEKKTKSDKRKTVKYTTSPIPLGSNSQISNSTSEERRHCIFYADDGGYQSTDNIDRYTNILYFIGIIDILTPYNITKKAEHLWKSATQDKNTISSVPPKIYGERFLEFMINAIRS
ncbi:unnamed protein product [Cunninghamella blakesleeana]